MESLRSLVFIKGNKLSDIWQRVNLSNGDDTNNESITDPPPEDEILLLQKNSDINKEAYLFHLLNQFIISFNNRNKSDISDLITHDSKLQHLLRYGLLKYLREWDDVSSSTIYNNITTTLRQVLYHWWMEILNNLKYEHRNNHSLKLDISLLTTLMECLNRIMNLLIYVPLSVAPNTEGHKKNFNNNDMGDELTNYCKHLLLTCHYITYQLDQNSKSNFTYPYLKQFNDLLYDQLGLINALAFIYFPDNFNYNLLVINLLTDGKFKIISNHNDPLLPWRKKSFKRIRNFPQRKRPISAAITDNKTNINNISCFRIIISYLQEEKTFQSFTYHYWRLIFLIYKHNRGYIDKNSYGVSNTNGSFLEMVNSSEIIIYYTVHRFFVQDIDRFKKITKQMNNNKNNNNNNIQFNKFINYLNSNKSINAFLEKKFQMLILWKHPLNKLFLQFQDIELVYSLLLYYDQKQLEGLKRISLYETQLTNLIFNKFLSVLILDIYRCNELINWHSWNQIIINCINTRSFENQINILKFIFNIWEYLPKENQTMILKHIIAMNNEMLLNFQHSHVNIIIIKLIIFKMLPFGTNKNSLISYLLSLEKNYNHLAKNQKKAVNWNHHNYRHPDSLLLFDNNRKYVLTHKKVPINEDFKNSYIVIDKEFNDSTRSKEQSEDLDDEEVPQYTARNESSKQKLIAIFKNIIMPYNNQQYDTNHYNNIWGNVNSKVNDQLDNNSNQMNVESNKILTFDLSVYKINNDIVIPKDRLPILSNTKLYNNNSDRNNEILLTNLHNFIKTFNLTMIEYYDFTSLYNENDIRIEI
ncbi:Ahk1p PWA37_003209 [Arxiozyma heterogenica]|uniref:Ahk1p n=1 Tax=Arxiozyma heterogenica TaxID=278026 RepID=UPI002F1D64E3